MKKLLTVALATAALGLATSALAQTAGPAGLPPQSPVGAKVNAKGKAGKAGKHGGVGKAEMEKINADVYDKLGLTADQKAKIMAHEKENEGKRKELKKSEKGASPADQEADKEKLKAMRKENKEFMKQILNKGQMKQMAKLRREEIAKYKASQAPAAPAKP